MYTDPKTMHGRCSVLLLLLVLVLAGACTKKDILPEPIGEKVPYTGAPTKSVKEIMDGASYTYWKAAWNRSGMAAVIKNGGAAYHTLFMPTNQAFEAAGWTMNKINTATVADLDSLLSYHVVKGLYKPENFTGIQGNVLLTTVLKRGDLPGYNDQQPYIYNLSAGVSGDSLLVNGLPANKWSAGEEATDGYVYPVAHLVPKPETNMWQYLEADPRFSLFVAAMRMSDEVYMENGVGISHETYLSGFVPVIRFTLFAPTNKAFQQSGFNTEDDIRAYMERSLPLGYADYDENWYYQQPKTAIDSLLFVHGLETYEAGTGNYTYPINLSFYSNDLAQNSTQLSGLLLKPGEMYNNPPVAVHLAFSAVNGKPMVKRLGSTRAPMALTQTNINTTNGVIHVLDEGLLLP